MTNKVFSLDQTTIKKLLTTYKLRIPEFQRGFVWKKAKKKQLLESLFKGFPIGAITLYEDENFYYIIDGLQRINTLNQYLSHPNEIIPFKEYYDEIKIELTKFLVENDISVNQTTMRKIIKSWYENFNKLYEFEKVSVLYKLLQNNSTMAKNFNDLELVEEFQKILIKNILISDEDIAIIIYSGDKDDLPELFKNINTGSVGLSQYEILQSVWTEYYLDAKILHRTFEGFNRELKLIENDYEINAIKEQGEFDIFKNMIGLNNIICCISSCDKLFTTFKKLANPIYFGEIVKYYDNDNVSFEIFSTLLYYTSNKIVKVVDRIFKNKNGNKEKITIFINKLNEIVINAINIAIEEIEDSEYDISNSKYHALYIVAGIIFSRYNIDVDSLSIIEIEINEKIIDKSLDFKYQIENNWFIDENRQMSFFNKKIKELVDIKNI